MLRVALTFLLALNVNFGQDQRNHDFGDSLTCITAKKLVSEGTRVNFYKLRDSKNLLYEFYVYAPRENTDFHAPCRKSFSFRQRKKREFQSLQNSWPNAKISVVSQMSNYTVTQLVNLTTDRSTVTAQEGQVRAVILSEKSNLRVKPEENFVNISVTSPQIIVNTSKDQSFEMTSSLSEIFVATKKLIQNFTIAFASEVTNVTVRQNSIEVQASADQTAKITVRESADATKNLILINSSIIDPKLSLRDLVIRCFTQGVYTEIQLIRGSLSIMYKQTLIQVSALNHQILIFAGQYAIKITTLYSPFTISITDLVEISIDNARLISFPDNNNISAYLQYSLMKVRADNLSSISFGSGALQNANIDIESKNITFQLVPDQSIIRSLHFENLAVLNTSMMANIATKSQKMMFEVLNGIPYILILTGNSSIELRKATSKDSRNGQSVKFTTPNSIARSSISDLSTKFMSERSIDFQNDKTTEITTIYPEDTSLIDNPTSAKSTTTNPISETTAKLNASSISAKSDRISSQVLTSTAIILENSSQAQPTSSAERNFSIDSLSSFSTSTSPESLSSHLFHNLSTINYTLPSPVTIPDPFTGIFNQTLSEKVHESTKSGTDSPTSL